MASSKNFKPHKMYDPKTGRSAKALTHAEYLKLKKRGFTDKPLWKGAKGGSDDQSFTEVVEKRLKGTN